MCIRCRFYQHMRGDHIPPKNESGKQDGGTGRKFVRIFDKYVKFRTGDNSCNLRASFGGHYNWKWTCSVSVFHQQTPAYCHQHAYNGSRSQWYSCRLCIYTLLVAYFHIIPQAVPTRSNNISVLHHVWYLHWRGLYTSTYSAQCGALSRNRPTVTSQNTLHEGFLRYDSGSLVVRSRDGKLTTGTVSPLSGGLHASRGFYVLFRSIYYHFLCLFLHLPIRSLPAGKKNHFQAPSCEASFQKRSETVHHSRFHYRNFCCCLATALCCDNDWHVLPTIPPLHPGDGSRAPVCQVLSL